MVAWPARMRDARMRGDWRHVGWKNWHEAVSVRSDYAKMDQHLPMIHIVFGNLDAWLLGTHHGVSPKHL